MIEWRLTQASEGLREHNDCHKPAGQPDGGQFCSDTPGLQDDGTVTLLHGTTKLNADRIRQLGFQAGTPHAIASQIEQRYQLPPGSVENHVAFQFAKGRTDLDRVFFTTDLSVAEQYTTPEVVQDALRAAWMIRNPTESVSREWRRSMDAWIKQEARRLAEPEVLAVNVPWAAVGEHSFGRKLSLDEFKNHPSIRGAADVLHNVSIPISALRGAKIRVYRRAS